MAVNVKSASDCQELIARIQQTLSTKGYSTNRIQGMPRPFPPNDTDVFEGLCRAILTRQANWASIVRILPALKVSLSNYSMNNVAALTDGNIMNLSNEYKNKVKARFLEDELFAIRNNAKVFQQIVSKHGSVCTFIKSYLPVTAYNSAFKCYVRPTDAPLINRFTNPDSVTKLRSVGLAICCEFFNNIGIDEFKPDVHTISFLNRISLNRTNVRVSRRSDDIREIGITIADTLGESRKYVDSHIWCFCAEDEGEICTEDTPKCDSCMLRLKQPQLCKGFPNRTDIVSNPPEAAMRFKECNLTRKEAEKKMKRAGLSSNIINSVLTHY